MNAKIWILTIFMLTICSIGLWMNAGSNQDKALLFEKRMPSQVSENGITATKPVINETPSVNRVKNESTDQIEKQFSGVIENKPLSQLLKKGRLLEKKERTTETVSLWEVADFKYRLLRVEERPDQEPVAMVADHVLVKKAAGVTDEDFYGWVEKQGLRVRKKMFSKNNFLLEIPEANVDSVPDTLARLVGAGLLAVSEPDFVVYALDTFPDDTSFDDLWGLHNTGQSGGTADMDIDAPEGWDISTGTDSLVVGVIDTGVDYGHTDLAGNMWVNAGEVAGDGLDNDGNGLVDDVRGWDFYGDDNDPMDDHKHGTHCAGTVAGVGNNALGVSGVAWSTRVMGLKFLGSSGAGSTSDGADALAYATLMGAKLTSNSWGGGGYSEVGRGELLQAYSNGVLFVAAAGNNAWNTDERRLYPAGYDVGNVISVGAYDHNGNLAGFSNYGTNSVDVAAPGVDVFSTVLNDGYGKSSGTSMATPHVAGMAALMLELNPGLSPEVVRSVLINSSKPIPALSGLVASGGSVSLYNALRAVSGRYVDLLSFVVDDDALGGTLGNADGVVSVGEVFGLDIVAKNPGTMAATGVVATLVSADPVFGLVSDVLALGDMSPGTQVAASNQFLVSVGATDTPHLGLFEVVFTDVTGDSWTNEIEVMVFGLGSVSGVVSCPTGTLAGATVTYRGDFEGSVLTDSNGFYSIVLRDGVYGLTASMPGYLDEGAYEVVLTNGAAVVRDFYFGTAQMNVVEDPIVVDLAKCATAAIPVVVESVGDGTLYYDLATSVPEWSPAGACVVATNRMVEGDESWLLGYGDNTFRVNTSYLTSTPFLAACRT